MLIKKDDIFLNYKFKNKVQALKIVGRIMVTKGYVEKKYIHSMIKRDKVASVAIGNGLAIGHGQNKSSKLIKKPGMILVKLSEPLKWDEEEVMFIVGLALLDDQQIDILQSLALTFADFKQVKKLYQQANKPEDILKFLEQKKGKEI